MHKDILSDKAAMRLGLGALIRSEQKLELERLAYDTISHYRDRLVTLQNGKTCLLGILLNDIELQIK